MSDCFYFSLFLSNSLLLISFLTGLVIGLPSKFRNLKWYAFYLGFILGFEIVNNVLIYILEIPSVSFVCSLSSSFGFFALSQMFRLDLKLTKEWKVVFYLISALLFIEVALLWYINETVVSNFGRILSHIFIHVGCAFILITSINTLEKSPAVLLIYGALFLFYTVSIFLIGLTNQWPGFEGDASYVIWSMNYFLSSILFGISLYAFYQLTKLK